MFWALVFGHGGKMTQPENHVCFAGTLRSDKLPTPWCSFTRWSMLLPCEMHHVSVRSSSLFVRRHPTLHRLLLGLVSLSLHKIVSLSWLMHHFLPLSFAWHNMPTKPSLARLLHALITKISPLILLQGRYVRCCASGTQHRS